MTLVFKITILKSITMLLILSCMFTYTSTSQNQYTIPIAAWSVYAADLDLDGNMDIITGHNYNWQTNWSGISVMKNNGDSTFYLLDSLYFFGGQVISCGQLDNNSNPEIIFKKESSSKEFIGILYNNIYSDTIFLDAVTYEGISLLTLGDIDNNGLTDIVFGSNNGQFWGIFYNYGYRNFSLPEYHYVTGYFPTSIACGDLNGDGRDDVVICGQSTEVYYSYSTGFQKEILETNNMKSMCAITDFDNDGDNDILTAVDIPIGNITSLIIYQNQNDTNLLEMPEVYFQPGSTNFFVTDFNNDCLPDIAFLSEYPYTLPDTTGGIYILYNKGGFLLSEPQFISLENKGEGWRNFYCADFDGNGYNDIAIIRTLYIPLAGNLEILYNDGSWQIGIENPAYTNGLETLQYYPNPFNIETTLNFEIQQYAQVELSVYNLHGKFIQCLTNEKLNGGKYSFKWNGLDKLGRPCKSGVYLTYIKVNGKIQQSFKLIKY